MKIVEPEDGLPPCPREPRQPLHSVSCGSEFRGCAPHCTFEYDHMVMAAIRAAGHSPSRGPENAAGEWVSVDDDLPKHRQAVLVRRNQTNWGYPHILGDGRQAKVWRWQACVFIRGRTAEEVEEIGHIRPQDQHDNNLRPYCWDEFGPGRLFGQDVSHWAPIFEPEEGP